MQGNLHDARWRFSISRHTPTIPAHSAFVSVATTMPRRPRSRRWSINCRSLAGGPDEIAAVGAGRESAIEHATRAIRLSTAPVQFGPLVPPEQSAVFDEALARLNAALAIDQRPDRGHPHQSVRVPPVHRAGAHVDPHVGAIAPMFGLAKARQFPPDITAGFALKRCCSVIALAVIFSPDLSSAASIRN